MDEQKRELCRKNMFVFLRYPRKVKKKKSAETFPKVKVSPDLVIYRLKNFKFIML